MTPQSSAWNIAVGNGPLIACAIHDGHEVRPAVAECLRLSSEEWLYEEDPYTGVWTSMASTQIVGRRSRFEVDLNRPREKAVYITPADAWGLAVWRCAPPAELVAESLQIYDAFYAEVRTILELLVARHGKVVVFDLHSYNHIRTAPNGLPADANENPEINLGTGTMDRAVWSPIVEAWLDAMRAYNYLGRSLDVRENVKFVGGQFPRWAHDSFPNSVCALAIEVKKFFMNEWTGELDLAKHRAIGEALTAAAGAVAEALEKI
jgi:N-formylglutamate amidohydrolase